MLGEVGFAAGLSACPAPILAPAPTDARARRGASNDAIDRDAARAETLGLRREAIRDDSAFAPALTAGTTPEPIAALGARKAQGEPRRRWPGSPPRPRVTHRKGDIKDPTHRYHLINDRTIPPVEESVEPTKSHQSGRNP